MRNPVFKLFYLLLFALVLGGCDQRQAVENQGGVRRGELSYEIGDTEVTITDCDETAEGDLEISAEIAGLLFTSIGEGAFDSCSSMTSITIPEGVTSILDFSFGSCSNLISITIPDSVSIIGRRAFHRCSSLASISIPDSVTTIGDFAFANCFGLRFLSGLINCSGVRCGW